MCDKCTHVFLAVNNFKKTWYIPHLLKFLPHTFRTAIQTVPVNSNKLQRTKNNCGEYQSRTPWSSTCAPMCDIWKCILTSHGFQISHDTGCKFKHTPHIEEDFYAQHFGFLFGDFSYKSIVLSWTSGKWKQKCYQQKCVAVLSVFLIKSSMPFNVPLLWLIHSSVFPSKHKLKSSVGVQWEESTEQNHSTSRQGSPCPWIPLWIPCGMDHCSKDLFIHQGFLWSVICLFFLRFDKRNKHGRSLKLTYEIRTDLLRRADAGSVHFIQDLFVKGQAHHSEEEVPHVFTCVFTSRASVCIHHTREMVSPDRETRAGWKKQFIWCLFNQKRVRCMDPKRARGIQWWGCLTAMWDCREEV